MVVIPVLEEATKHQKLAHPQRWAIWLMGLGLLVILAAGAMGGWPLYRAWQVHREADAWLQRAHAWMQKQVAEGAYPSPPAQATPLPEQIDRDTTLRAAQSPYYIRSETTLKRNVRLSAEPGVEILFGPGGALIAFGDLQFQGTQERPVRLRPVSSQLEWAGLFIGPGQVGTRFAFVELERAIYGVKSVHARVDWENTTLTNVREAYSGLKSQTRFYRCRILFKDYQAHGNVNLVRFFKGTAEVQECEVHCPPADLKIDAFDVDHVERALFRGNRIYGAPCQGADALDVGVGSREVLIVGNLISDFTDKGVSVGEAARVTATNNVIVRCGMGVGVKDEGLAEIENFTFYQTKVGVACFEKIPGQGGGTARIAYSAFVDVEEADVTADLRSNVSVAYSVSEKAVLPGIGNRRVALRLENPERGDWDVVSAHEADSSLDEAGAGRVFLAGVGARLP